MFSHLQDIVRPDAGRPLGADATLLLVLDEDAEILLGLLVLGVLFLVDKRLGKEKRPRGALISTFFVVYFIGRFIVEFWKEYEPPIPASTPYPSSLTTGQLLSLPGIALGLFGLYWSLKHKIPAGWPSVRLVEDVGMREERRQKAKKRFEEELEDEEDDDDEPDDEKDERDTKRKRKEPDETDARDEEEDDDERDADDDDDEDDDERDDQPARPHDPDIDDEFDEKGALKRRRGPPEG